LTVEKLEAFIPQLMSMLHVECLVHGNMDKESALNLVNLVEKKLAGNTLPLKPQHLLRYRDMRFEDGNFYAGNFFPIFYLWLMFFRLQLCVRGD
jgi:insulysin